MNKKSIIASRVLKTASDGQKTSVRLDLSVPFKKGRVWTCDFNITATGVKIAGSAHGEDSLQALILGLDAIRKAFDNSGLAASWLSGEAGDIGIPLLAPMAFGYSVQRKAEESMKKTLAYQIRNGLRKKGIRSKISVGDL